MVRECVQFHRDGHSFNYLLTLLCRYLRANDLIGYIETKEPIVNSTPGAQSPPHPPHAAETSNWHAETRGLKDVTNLGHSNP